MTDINDCGPAYDRAGYYAEQQPDKDDLSNGMTLRDYFAGQVLPSIHTSSLQVFQTDASETWPEMVARRSYRLADAMIAARSAKDETK